MLKKEEAATDCESEQTCVTGKLSEITAGCPDLLPYLWQWEVINANDCRACKNKTKQKKQGGRIALGQTETFVQLFYSLRGIAEGLV